MVSFALWSTLQWWIVQPRKRALLDLWCPSTTSALSLPMETLRKKAISLLVMDLFLTEEGTHFESGAVEGDTKSTKSVCFKVSGLKEHRSQGLRYSMLRLPCQKNYAASCTCTLEIYMQRSRNEEIKLHQE